MFNFETYYLFEDKNFNEIEIKVLANVNKFIPGKYYGAPENCFQAEGGDCNNWKLFLNDKILTDDEFENMGGDLNNLLDYIEDQFCIYSQNLM